jgi:hypothetical protein
MYLSSSLQRLSQPPRGAKVADAGVTERFSGSTLARTRSQVGFVLETETSQHPELDGYNICVELLYVGSCQCRPQESISVGHSADMSASLGRLWCIWIWICARATCDLLDRGTVANAFLDRGTVANALAEPQTRKERIVAMVKKLATPLIVTGVLN